MLEMLENEKADVGYQMTAIGVKFEVGCSDPGSHELRVYSQAHERL